MPVEKMSDERAAFARQVGLGAFADQSEHSRPMTLPTAEPRLPQAPDVDMPAALGVSAFTEKK